MASRLSRAGYCGVPRPATSQKSALSCCRFLTTIFLFPSTLKPCRIKKSKLSSCRSNAKSNMRILMFLPDPFFPCLKLCAIINNPLTIQTRWGKSPIKQISLLQTRTKKLSLTSEKISTPFPKSLKLLRSTNEYWWNKISVKISQIFLTMKKWPSF